MREGLATPGHRARIGRAPRAVAVALLALLAAAAYPVAGATPPAPSTHSKPAVRKAGLAKPATRRPAPRALSPADAQRLATSARSLEEMGGYTRATEALRQLRSRVAPDGDLELALAIDEARSGDLDSARVRLWGPLLTAALADTLPVTRRQPYAWQREPRWLNGRFDGWHWYVARARAEVAAALGRWGEAHAAAILAVAARPMAGKEWLVLAISAAHDGTPGEAQLAAEMARRLDPTLPEAQYLAGLLDWRAGRRNEAQAGFRAAVALDSTYRDAAIALVRSRLPGAAPDTLPTALLVGAREAGLLTSPVRPKLEEFVQMDSPALIVKRGPSQVPESLTTQVRRLDLILPVLVDERGRAVLNELPWFSPATLPAPVVSALLAGLPEWRFSPARRNGAAQRVWAAVQYSYRPSDSTRAGKP